MKKLINGSQIDITDNIGFFSDYLYGNELHKITMSTIDNELNFGKDINDIIEDYRNCYYALHPVMQVIESDTKYCLMGELIGRPYKVIKGKLSYELKGSRILFKGTYWSIEDIDDTKGITWNDCKTLNNFGIYKIYLDCKGKKFIQLAFPELWAACDENKEKVNNELDTILQFIDVKPIELDDNEIIDVDLNIKYRIIPSFTGNDSNKKSKKLVIDLDDDSIDVKQNSKDIYTYSVYKQEIIEGQSGKKDYGKEVKVDNIFTDIFNTIKANNCNSVRGIKVNGEIYYECNKDIWVSKNNESHKVIQKGKIYGVKVRNLLVEHKKDMEQDIVKQTIYLLKDDMLDIAQINFLKENSSFE